MGLNSKDLNKERIENMKVLVTGGAGFIGGNFVHHMVNKYPEYDIVNLDLLTYVGLKKTEKTESFIKRNLQISGKKHQDFAE